MKFFFWLFSLIIFSLQMTESDNDYLLPHRFQACLLSEAFSRGQRSGVSSIPSSSFFSSSSSSSSLSSSSFLLLLRFLVRSVQHSLRGIILPCLCCQGSRHDIPCPGRTCRPLWNLDAIALRFPGISATVGRRVYLRERPRCLLAHERKTSLWFVAFEVEVSDAPAGSQT